MNQNHPAARLLKPHRRRPTRIGLVSGGLGAYWPQFPELLPQLQESVRYVTSLQKQIYGHEIAADVFSFFDAEHFEFNPHFCGKRGK